MNQPYPYHPPRPTSGLATVSLWMSILGLLTFGVLSVVGAIMGIFAYRETKDGRVGGKGQAISAIIVGVVLGLPTLILAAIFFIGLLGAFGGAG